MHPAAQNLTIHPDRVPGFHTAFAVMYQRQRQQPPNLIAVTCRRRKPAKPRRSKIRPQPDRCHPKLPSSQALASHFR